MKRVGCLLALVGLAALGGGGYLLVGAGMKAVGAAKEFVAQTPAALLELKPGRTTSDPITVKTDRKCRLILSLDLLAKAAREKRREPDRPGAEPRVDYEALYAVPFAYRVLGEDGHEIFAESARVASGAGGLWVVTASGKVDAGGGPITVNLLFTTFPVPPPGRVRLEVDLGADTEHGAEVRAARLSVDDQAGEAEAAAAGATTAFPLLGLGGLLLLAGLVVFLIGLGERRTPPPEGAIRPT